jgi:hypothetical protein
MMAIGPSDFEQLNEIFEEFSSAMTQMTGKNRERLTMNAI